MEIILTTGEHAILDTSTPSVPATQPTVYVHTERPLYRAGDTVHISGIARTARPDGYDIARPALSVVLRDPQYTQVTSQDVTPDSLGAFTADVKIGTSAPLGDYTVSVESTGSSSAISVGSSNFSVEEYQKPIFAIGSVTDQTSYHYGDTMSLTITGAYYAGAPLA